MRDDDSSISMIDKWSNTVDEMWASVLNDPEDDDHLGWSMNRPKRQPSELDLTLDKSLSLVDEETVEGFSCFLDGMLLTMSPEEEDDILEKEQSKQVKKGASTGLPPRPGSGLPPRPTKKKVASPERREEDTNEDGDQGYFSFLYGSNSANEKREESHPHSNDVSTKESDNPAPVPLVRRMSFKRVGSSFRRERRPPPEDDEEDNLFSDAPLKEKKDSPEDEAEGSGLLSFMFGAQEEEAKNTNDYKPGNKASKPKEEKDDNYGFFSMMFSAEEDSLDTPTSSSKDENKASLAKKFSRSGANRPRDDDSMAAAESVPQVRLVRRTSFRRERSGRRPETTLRSLQAERF